MLRDFKRLHRTSSDLMTASRLQKTSWDFKGFHKTSKTSSDFKHEVLIVSPLSIRNNLMSIPSSCRIPNKQNSGFCILRRTSDGIEFCCFHQSSAVDLIYEKDWVEWEKNKWRNSILNKILLIWECVVCRYF